MKKSISIFNLTLSVLLFLCFFGNTCYRLAYPNRGGADFGQQLFLTFYFAGFIFISIFCVCKNPYYSNKHFLFGAIYSAIYPVVLTLAWLLSLAVETLQLGDINWIYWLSFIIVPVVSALYFYATFKKD